MKITITLREPARTQAEQSLIARGLRDMDTNPYIGPEFVGNLSCSDDWFHGFFGIKVWDAPDDEANYKAPVSKYFYPVQDIARLKIEP